MSDLDFTYLYGITDNLTFTTASQASSETFSLLDTAPPDSNFKGVSFTPTIPAGNVEITTSPSGLTVTTAGTGCAPGTYIAPVTLSWTPGNSCTLSVVTPQVVSGTQYVFTQWADGNTSTTDTVMAPATTAVYTANFTTTQAGIYSPAPGLDTARQQRYLPVVRPSTNQRVLDRRGKHSRGQQLLSVGKPAHDYALGHHKFIARQWQHRLCDPLLAYQWFLGQQSIYLHSV